MKNKPLFLFEGMSESEIEGVLLNANGLTETYSAGDAVVERFEKMRELSFVLEGELRVYGGKDCRVLLNSIGSGGCFGVSTLFGGKEEFPTRIVAYTDATLFRISEENLKKLLRTYPQAAINYVTFLSDRIRFLNRRVESFAVRSAESKVASFLLANTDEDGLLDTHLNMSEIASALGIGRASFYRILDTFTADGWIEGHGRSIRIKNKIKLERIQKS